MTDDCEAMFDLISNELRKVAYGPRALPSSESFRPDTVGNRLATTQFKTGHAVGYLNAIKEDLLRKCRDRTKLRTTEEEMEAGLPALFG